MSEIYLCAEGCGEIKREDMIQDKEALKNEDKSLYCPECHGYCWFILPGDEE